MSNPSNNSYYDEGSMGKLQRKARESPVMPIGKKIKLFITVVQIRSNLDLYNKKSWWKFYKKKLHKF